MTKKTLFVACALVCALAAKPVHACINEIGTNYRGESVYPMVATGGNLKTLLERKDDRKNLVRWSRHVIKEARADPSPDNMDNLASVLVRLGKYPSAIKLLRHIEDAHPGRYQTAANLGTALELSGQNQEALRWINEGMRRNRDSHHGTEWLHARILQAKVDRDTSGQTGKKSILKLEFGDAAMPRRPSPLPVGNAGKPVSLYELGVALRYQLMERTEFVAPPDRVVAGLLLDWANLELLAGTVESADVLYDLALRYGSEQTALVALRKREIARILAKAANGKRREGECEICVRILPPPPPPKA